MAPLVYRPNLNTCIVVFIIYVRYMLSALQVLFIPLEIPLISVPALMHWLVAQYTLDECNLEDGFHVQPRLSVICRLNGDRVKEILGVRVSELESVGIEDEVIS